MATLRFDSLNRESPSTRFSSFVLRYISWPRGWRFTEAGRVEKLSPIAFNPCDRDGVIIASKPWRVESVECGLIMYGGRRRMTIREFSLSSFLPSFLEFHRVIREIMLFKIEMTVQVWKKVYEFRVSFPFFPWQVYRTEEDVIFFEIEIMSNVRKFVESNSL